MKTCQIYPLLLGEGALDKASLTFRLDAGKMISIPFLSYLIQNDDTNILVDTGVGTPEFCSKYHYPIRKSKDQEMESVLNKLNLTPDDIDYVILTHLHFDHCGNNGVFPHAKFFVQKEELECAYDPLPIFYGSYEKNALLAGDTPVWYETRNRFIAIEGDYEVMDGIKIISLPGHSPGSQGVIVNTVAGKYAITGDCVPLYECWENEVYGEPRPGGILTDMYAFYRSLKKLKLESNFILPGHDYRVLNHRVYPPRQAS